MNSGWPYGNKKKKKTLPLTLPLPQHSIVLQHYTQFNTYTVVQIYNYNNIRVEHIDITIMEL
jgi:hypothetical protein